MDNGPMLSQSHLRLKIGFTIMCQILPFILTLKSFGKKSYNFRIFIGEFVSESGEVD